MLYAWDKVDKIVAIVKKELWYLGIIALVAYKCGTIFIDRKNPKNAYKTLEKISNVLKTDGVNTYTK